MYVCNVCKREPFRVPADPIGVELMRAHLDRVHGIPRPTPDRQLIVREWDDDY